MSESLSVLDEDLQRAINIRGLIDRKMVYLEDPLNRGRLMRLVGYSAAIYSLLQALPDNPAIPLGAAVVFLALDLAISKLMAGVEISDLLDDFVRYERYIRQSNMRAGANWRDHLTEPYSQAARNIREH